MMFTITFTLPFLAYASLGPPPRFVLSKGVDSGGTLSFLFVNKEGVVESFLIIWREDVKKIKIAQ